MKAYPDSSFHANVNIRGFSNKLNTDWLPRHENLHNQTMEMMKILNVQNNKTRAERRKQKTK
jgi:hypothetical protein